jgi:hypothetical protein
MAQMVGMLMIKAGIVVDQTITFGQPRLGNKAYAKFSQEKFPQWRVVHHQDEAAHLPYLDQLYYHTHYEVYEDEFGTLRQCDASGEDPTCADQWKQSEWNIDDHLTYLGMCLHKYCGNCDPNPVPPSSTFL